MKQYESVMGLHERLEESMYARYVALCHKGFQNPLDDLRMILRYRLEQSVIEIMYEC